MPTHYFLRPDGTLRHGHPALANPTKEQWHNAAVYHRDDPDAHEREESWSDPQWSSKNWQVPRVQREILVHAAHCDHDRTRRTSNYYIERYKTAESYENPQRTPSPAPAPPPPPREEPEPAWPETEDEDEDEDEEPAPTPTPTKEPELAPVPVSELPLEPHPTPALSSDEAPDLALIEERLSTLEEMALVIAGPMEGRLAAAEGHLLRLDERQPDLSPVISRIEALEEAQARRVILEIRSPSPTEPPVIADVSAEHEKFPMLVKLAIALRSERRNIWLSGPAGSGKTSAAHRLAALLKRPFDYLGGIDTPYKLSGFINATGYQSTAFRRMYETGGVILLDELDSSSPAALLEVNAALANGYASFPDGLVQRHDNCVVIGAGNTWGLGADAQYTGRTKLDAAFLDRFVKIAWDYDENLEARAAQATHDDPWLTVVRKVRRATFSSGAHMVISPRASITGCELLRTGLFTNEEVVEAVFGSYRKHPTWATVGAAAESFALSRSPSPAPSSPAPTNNQPKPLVSALHNVNFARR